MGFSEGLSDTGDLTGAATPVRGAITGAGSFLATPRKASVDLPALTRNEYRTVRHQGAPVVQARSKCSAAEAVARGPTLRILLVLAAYSGRLHAFRDPHGR